jgi:hypothetical protein
MMQRPMKFITLLVLCGVIALSASALGGPSATSAKGPTAAAINSPAKVEIERAAPVSWLAKALRIHLGVWFGIQFDPPSVKGGKPSVTSPTSDGPAKSQTDPRKPKLWEVLSDHGGDEK